MEFCKTWLLKQNKHGENSIRGDYRELAECTIVLLGETPPGQFTWKKPGACHKARFMAFGIYSLKALAFSQQLDLEEETVEGLKQFFTFLMTIYVLHFLASSIGSSAAVNDLILYKKLFNYRNVDPKLAEEALVVLRWHGWYLIPETAVFSIFSDDLSEDEVAGQGASYPESSQTGKQ